MRIRQLELIKYGKFTGEALHFPKKGTHDFHLVVGPNEAGKSTVRNAVLELLFGMPARTPLGFLHDLPELRLGGVLETDTGSDTVFHRVRGKTQLRTPSDDKLADDFLASALGTTSKDFFEQMFGLDHDRLVEGGRGILDASKDLGRVLFQSAAGIQSLGPVREALEARATELWTRRGTGNEYAQAEARLHEANAQLKATQVRTKVWSEARDALAGVEDDIAKAQQERLRLDLLRGRFERIRRLAQPLRELVTREAELAQLAQTGEVIELPPTAFADLSRSQVDLAVARRVIEERGHEVDARRLLCDAIVTDDEVLALSRDIEALDSARGACIHHPRDLLLQQAEAQRLLGEAASDGAQLAWPGDEAALRANIPGVLALKTVTHLLREHGALHQARVGAQDAVQEKRRELTLLREQLDGLATTVVPHELRGALEEAQPLKGSRARQRTLAADVEEAARLLAHALTGLGRWPHPVETLRRMVLPVPSQLAILQRRQQELQAALALARAKANDAADLVERLAIQERQFTESRHVVTPTQVRAARAGRDQRWSDIKRAIVSLEAGAPAVDAAIQLADELVDSQLGTATEAAALQGIQNQLELARADAVRRQAALKSNEEELSEFDVAWRAMASEAGLADIALFDIADWLVQRDKVLAADDIVRQRRRDLSLEEGAHADASVALRHALGLALVAVADTDDLASLVASGTALLQKAEAERSRKEGIERQLAQADVALQNAAAKAAVAADAYGAWESQWRDALAATRLGAAATTLAQAEGAVELANNVAAKLAQADHIRQERIATMQSELDAFEAEAHRIAAIVEPTLLELGDWPEVSRRLLARLRAAGVAAERAAQAQHALRESRRSQEEAQRVASEAEARILPLLNMAGVHDVEAALALAQRSDTRRALRESIAEAKKQLADNGDGLPREAIEAEIAEHDPASVIALLEQSKRDLAAGNDRLALLFQQRVTAQQKFGAIDGHADAAMAEARRQEALSAMGEAAEQYLQAATASRLLKWAIDRYRQQKQGPMLMRAGEIFSTLTLDQFGRLVVDHEMSPPALFAKRTGGKLVEVAGLSEGTRDQLFLALRIAALELHLQHGKVLPFIADDLFVNFDDQRARAGLQALRELSARTQVLFLTHHDHLVPLAREVFGETLNVVPLARTPVLA